MQERIDQNIFKEGTLLLQVYNYDSDFPGVKGGGFPKFQFVKEYCKEDEITYELNTNDLHAH